jgi:RNA polymerase sigma factor (sigma-70 family)
MDSHQDLPHSANWPVACERYSPLLLNALARLAKEGYGIPFNEGLDLIHDFFMEHWAGVLARFDKNRDPPVSFPTYLYRAFVLFARRRIIFLNQWRSSLTDTAWLAKSIEGRGTHFGVDEDDEREQAALAEARIESVRAALAQLPTNAREFLFEYLGSPQNSERHLAQKHGVTRYRVRELLTEAFGNVLAAVGHQGEFTNLEWRTASILWGRGRPVSAAARELGVSPAEVRRTRSRILSRMSIALSKLVGTTTN